MSDWVNVNAADIRPPGFPVETPREGQAAAQRSLDVLQKESEERPDDPSLKREITRTAALAGEPNRGTRISAEVKGDWKSVNAGTVTARPDEGWVSVNQEQKKPEAKSDRGEFMKGLIGGMVSANPKMFGAAAKGIGTMTGWDWLKAQGDKLAALGDEKAKDYQPATGSIADVRTDSVTAALGDFFTKYLPYQTGNALASMAPSIASGILGASAGSAVAGPPGAAVGGFAGIVLTGYPMNYGDIYSDALDDKGIQQAVKAGKLTDQDVAKITALAAVPITALDSWSLGRFGAALTKDIKAGLYKRIFSEMAAGGLREGTTEGLQQIISEVVQHSMGSDKTAAQHAVAVVDNAIGGLMGGVVAGGGAGVVQGAKASVAPPDAQAAPQAPAATEAQPSAPEPSAGAQGPSFADQFMAKPPRELSTLEQARVDGQQLKETGSLPVDVLKDTARFEAAQLMAAYGDNAAVAKVIEHPELTGGLKQAMMEAAPTVERVRAKLAASEQSSDITSDIVSAVDELAALKASGKTLDEAMLGMSASYESRQLVKFLHDNVENPQKIAQLLESYMGIVESMGGVPSEVRGRAFDIIQERNVARQHAQAAEGRDLLEKMEKKQTEEAAYSERQTASEKRDAEIARLKDEDRKRTQKSVKTDRAVKIAAELRSKAVAKKPEEKTAMSLAMEKAKGSNREKQNGAVGGRAEQIIREQNAVAAAKAAVASVPGAPEIGHAGEPQSVRAGVSQEGATALPENVGDGTRESPVQAAAPEHVAVAAERAAELPTPAQIDAGVNKKGHFQFAEGHPLRGLGVISIETAKGAPRVHKRGEWQSPPMPAHYGHLQNAAGADGDKADITIGDHLDAKNAYVIDQIHPETEKFDETKSFVGFQSKKAAVAAYLGSFSDDAKARIGAVTEMPNAQFVQRARANNLHGPVAYEEPEKELQVPPDTHDILRKMAEAAVWFEEGGHGAGGPGHNDQMAKRLGITKTQVDLNEEGAGRTQWIGMPDWARGFGMNREDITKAVNKAIDGKNLGKKQKAMVEAMLAEIAELRAISAEVRDAPSRAWQDEVVGELAVAPAPVDWNTMSEEQQNAELDAIFGPQKSSTQGGEVRAPAAQEEVGPAGEQGREPGQDDEERVVGLRRYAKGLVDSGKLDAVYLVGSKVTSANPNDVDILYEFPPGLRTEAEVERAIEAVNRLDLDTYDTFIKSGDRYFHVQEGAGRTVVANDAYGKQQEGKPRIVLAQSENKYQSLRDAFEQYDNPTVGVGITSEDLLDIVEGLIDDGSAPESLREPAEAYRESIRENNEEYAGRGETEPQEEAFIDAVRDAVEGRPSLALEAPTEASLRAKEAQAETGNVEERHAAVRDRNESILSAPEGTAPPRDVSEAKVPTQQEGLFSRGKVTETPAFKAWFRESKVVDDAGNPLVVYHATHADFADFSRTEDIGFHFSTGTDGANNRIQQMSEDGHAADGANIKPVFLSIQRPIRLPDMATWEPKNVIAAFAREGVLTGKQADSMLARGVIVDRSFAKKWLNRSGYDGIVYRNDTEMGGLSYIALDATQIKSAIGNRGTFDPTKKNILFRRGEERRILSNDAISQTIAPMLAKWKNAPEVVTINSMADAPQAVKLTYMRQQEGGAVGEPEAFIYRNKVYLVADGLSSPEAATRALLHESVGHFGLRGTLGERLDPILDEVAKSMPLRMKAKAREYGFNLGDASERRQAAEEVLAQMAQEMPHIGVVKKLIAAIRQFLREIGVHLNLSDNDVIAKYILPARGFVERGEFTKMVEAPAFSRMSAAIETARQKNYKELATGFVDRLDQALNPLGTLPEQEKYLIRRYEAQGHIEKADEAAKGIRQALPAASEADQAAIFDYLTTVGANSGAIVDPVTRHSAEQIKADINRVGDDLVAHGLLSEESRAQYRDAYLPRLYLKHLLSEQDWKALGAGKKPSDMGYLKARKDIAEDVRKVIMGEVRDPGFLAAVAVAKPMRDMALLDWLGDISQNEKWILPGTMVDFKSPLTGKSQRATPFHFKNEAVRLRKQARYYAPEEAAKAEREAKAMDQAADDALEGVQGTHENYKQIPNTARYGRLRGMLVRSEIYDDLMGVQDFLPTDPGWFQNVFGYGGVGTKATGIWKAMKVSMNPPAQIRNFVSNGVLIQLSGVPLRLVPARVIQATRDVLDGGKYSQIAKKYGVGVSTFATQEVHRMKTELLDLEMKTRGMGPLGRLHRLAALTMNKAGDFYQMSETIFKTAKIIDAMEREGMSEQKAVLEANKWLFDYSLVQKSLRYARSAPIGVPFATFSMKVLPRLVEVAMHHPQRFLPWVGLFYGFPMMVASMLGVDKDDLDKLKKALPQWLQDKGHALILPYKDDQGRWQVVDLGYFMPWTNWTELAGNVGSGELGKAIQGAGIFGGPLTDIITAVKTGKDPFTGRDIIAKGDPPERQAVALLNYVWNMAMPPILTDRGLVSPMGLLDQAYGGKLTQALSGTTNKFGEPRASATQALLYAAGVNVNAMTPEYTRATNLQVMQRDMQDVKTQMVQKLYDRSLTDEQRRDIAKEYATELIRRTDKMKKYMRESEIAPALATQH